MKIVCTVSGKELSSPLDPRFGRAAAFLVYDLETEAVEVIDNPHVNANQGAGIQAAETVVQTGAKAILTGRCGPKAFRVLQSAGVKIFLAETGTAEQAISLYREGKLREADAPVEGGGGMGGGRGMGGGGGRGMGGGGGMGGGRGMRG